MVDINLYRNRIGNFNLKGRHNRLSLGKIFRYQRCENNQTSINILTAAKMLVKLILILVLFQPGMNLFGEHAVEDHSCARELLPGGQVHAVTQYQLLYGLGGQICRREWDDFISWEKIVVMGQNYSPNFRARYLYGNIKRGIKNMHVNI